MRFSGVSYENTIMTGTKIIATIGPSCESSENIEALITAGADVIRFNLKHNSPEWHLRTIGLARESSRKAAKPVAIMADIPGSDKVEIWFDLVTSGVIDYVALSYIREADEVSTLKTAVKARSPDLHIIAKLETAESLENMEGIITVADAIMVARGDLGEAIPIEEIPYHQKRVIKRSLEMGKPVITATEMLNSMIEHPSPTRAEVSDVANAVYDCTDAVMLSGESAVGKYPKDAVAMMHSITRYIDTKRPKPLVRYEIRTQTDALTFAANDLAKQQVIESRQVKAFVVITETGDTARSLARLRPSIPIIAVTRHERVCNQLLLVWGVSPLLFNPSEGNTDIRIGEIREVLKNSHIVAGSDHVIMVYGSEVGVHGNTNVLRIETV